MKTSVDVLLLIAMPVAIGMMCTSDILILLFSGEEFLSGSLAAKILSAKVVIGAINRILAYQVCIPYKRDREVLISTVSGAIFNLFMNAVLIPRFGVNGASVATFFSEVIVFIVLTYFSSRFFITKSLYIRGGIYLVASLWFFVVRYMMNQMMTNTLLILSTTVILCAAGYFVILIIIK